VKYVNICGIDHKIIEKEDVFNAVDTHFGQIDYTKSIILINSELSEQQKHETLCHEILHGILIHIGKTELSQDEEFVQCLANAIHQSFGVKLKEDNHEI